MQIFFNSITSSKSVSRYLPISKSEEFYFKLINKKVITPTHEEIDANPPSRSAKLRSIKRHGIENRNKVFVEKFEKLLEIEKTCSKL